MWWLCYQRDGRLFGVAIVEASSASAARMRASREGLVAGGAFTQAIQLTADMVKRLAPEDIGRTLSPTQAERVLKRFDRSPSKKPAAPGIRRSQ
jgi:hypothetical protein